MPRAALILLLLALAASNAHAVATLRGLPAVAHPGDRLELRWGGLGMAAEEAELELSLDGGRWVRISPELDAHEGRFEWQVPEWASGVARLRLRVGGEGFEESEACAREFVIRGAGADAPTAPAGEWWRLERPSRAHAFEELECPALDPLEPLAAIPPAGAGAVPFGVSRHRALFASAAAEAAASRPASRVRTPLRVPLRN